MARPLTLAGIFAHPHDETWSLAGTFALLVPKGVRPAPQAEDPPEPSLLEAFDG